VVRVQNELWHYYSGSPLKHEEATVDSPAQRSVPAGAQNQFLISQLFGRDWEGYSDYSHYGIQQMTPGTIRRELASLSWDILEWDCPGVWHWNQDPVFQCLNNLWGHDQRFQKLVSETETGDFIQLVARKLQD